MRPERFTEQAKEILANSQAIAARYRHIQWDVEHILLALLEQESGLTLQILGRLGVNVEAVKKRVEDHLEILVGSLAIAFYNLIERSESK